MNVFLKVKVIIIALTLAVTGARAEVIAVKYSFIKSTKPVGLSNSEKLENA